MTKGFPFLEATNISEVYSKHIIYPKARSLPITQRSSFLICIILQYLSMYNYFHWHIKTFSTTNICLWSNFL